MAEKKVRKTRGATGSSEEVFCRETEERLFLLATEVAGLFSDLKVEKRSSLRGHALGNTQFLQSWMFEPRKGEDAFGFGLASTLVTLLRYVGVESPNEAVERLSSEQLDRIGESVELAQLKRFADERESVWRGIYNFWGKQVRVTQGEYRGIHMFWPIVRSAATPEIIQKGILDKKRLEFSRLFIDAAFSVAEAWGLEFNPQGFNAWNASDFFGNFKWTYEKEGDLFGLFSPFEGIKPTAETISKMEEIKDWFTPTKELSDLLNWEW